MIDKNGFFKNYLKYQYPDEKEFTIAMNYHSASQIQIQDESTRIFMK